MLTLGNNGRGCPELGMCGSFPTDWPLVHVVVRLIEGLLKSQQTLYITQLALNVRTRLPGGTLILNLNCIFYACMTPTSFKAKCVASHWSLVEG